MAQEILSNTLKPLPVRKAGHMLLTTATAVAILAGLTGVSMQRSMQASRIGARATNFAIQARAADGALEYAFGVWKKAIIQKDSPLNKTTGTDAAVLTPSMPSITGISYTVPLKIEPVDAFGAPASSPVPARIYLADYPGWNGYAYGYLASVTVQATAGRAGLQPKATGAKRLFQYVTVPLFQTMYFYETDLEIYRPAPMIVSGLVHSNSRMLISGSGDKTGAELTFSGNVSYAGGTSSTAGYSTTEPPLGGPTWAGFSTSTAIANMEAPTYSNGGEAQQVNKVERAEPLGKSPGEVLSTTDTNPNNDTFREIVEPPVTGQTDPPEIAKRRMYTKAGIIMTVNGTATTSITVTAQNGTTLTTTQINSLKAAYTGKTTMYDQREGKNVDVANFNVSALTSVLNSVSGFNGVLYIHDITPSVSGDLEPKTVRLKNGGVLPNNGLTVASQNPVYVQGDYNTGTTTSPTSVPANATGNPNNTDSPTVSTYTRKPASVMADSVMLLSNSWNDANSSLALSNRVASNTTYNMAILAGFLPSGFDRDGSGSAAPYGYSGGANNFPRFLENWGNKSCTYYGSMVNLYQSKTFIGKWDTGVIYNPPNRRWNFDTNYSTNPPPGSLDAVTIQRGGWMRF